ncbi:adenylosuccinate lyase [Candidatus Fermentibacteria bacterium]|nr:MAG: adenylosuccinate lyase [Candidatus Fermentibacteria bacterium]
MIDRYAIGEMTDIWTTSARYARWLEIEILAVEARYHAGLVPEEDYIRIRNNASFDTDRVNEIELVTRHDVIAFLTSVSESLGDESRHIHYGMTSSDILDTCFAMQIRDSGKLIMEALDQYGKALSGLVKRTKGIVCMGRTHGMNAEPTTLALKFAGHYSEYLRCRRRLEEALKVSCVGTISGAVGTFAYLDPSVEEFVCGKLGLGVEEIPTQVVARDRHAQFLYALAAVGGAMERFATECRHLQRTEVGEAEERFGKGQKGSSAMPHKRNPIVGERLCGLARLLRGYLQTGLENTSLWHERDISHSAAERFIFPDACGVALYGLRKAADLAGGLRVFPEAVALNVKNAGDRYFSQSVMLALVRHGSTREDAYAIVQEIAMSAMENGTSFAEAVSENEKVAGVVPAEELADICTVDNHLRNESYLLNRIGLA